MAAGNRDPHLWLARTGEGGYALTDCVERGIVALRYRTVGDARDLSIDQIAAAVGEAGTRTALVAVATMLHAFIHSVQPGDIVVTPHAASRTVYLGEITGPYEWADPAPVADLLHYRAVTWLGSLDRDTDIPADRLKDIDRPPTFYELADQSWWRERADAARARGERVVAPTRAPRRTPAEGSGSVTRRRPEIPTMLCAVCFLQKPTDMVEDEICSDCR